MASSNFALFLYPGRIWLTIGAFLLSLMVACSASAPPTGAPAPLGSASDAPAASSETISPTGPPVTAAAEANEPPIKQSVTVINIFDVPRVDTSIADVPLGDIVFDTFGRTAARFIPLSRIDEEFILELRDAIAPIYQPVYGSPETLPWLSDDDLVMGYVSGTDAFAYPINVLNFHELVNDEIDGLPVLISYCPLCASGVVYNRELAGETLLFGNTSALYQSDLVMYDHQTGSYWFQVAGEAVVGTMTGSRLSLLPSTTMSWGEWRLLYPETVVLTGMGASPTMFQQRRYSRDVFTGYEDRVNDGKFAFPVAEDKLDNRLTAGELVLTVEVGEAITAYPLDRIGDAAINDQVGDIPVVVFSRADGQAVGAFSPKVDDRILTFQFRQDDDSFIDQETGSTWNTAGFSIAGPLAGTQLRWLNVRRAFWFSIIIAFPGVTLYIP